MTKPPHLALIGAGITGTTLSIALTRCGISHTLYEQSPHATELGAGLGFGPNAARAMKIIDRELSEVFERVCTPRDLRGAGVTTTSSTTTTTKDCEEGNGTGDGEKGGKGEGGGEDGKKGKLWIEFLDGTSDVDVRELEPAFRVFARYPVGHGAVHRARWLEVLMRMVPEGVVKFGKRLEGIDQSGEKVVLRFEDGTKAEADAVVGCDGVKSKVREVLVGGGGMQGAKCGYSGKYAYRCMIPMQRAVEEIGRARASVSSLWMGHGRHILTFPVGRPGPDQLLNLVAFVTDSNESWPSQDARGFTLPATREDALHDFEQGGFSKTWGLFDLANDPLPSFYSGRILVIGDAAHASTPHHGSGAGFCMEDVAVLSCLLEEQTQDVNGDPTNGLEAVFAAFDASRRERDQWLVQSSRRAADLYEWRLPNTGKEYFEDMRKDIEERQAVCWGVDLDKVVLEAKADLRRRRGAEMKG
ncbi:hypothetical protein C8A01DRAFT_17381 [Parachaetomium inaequale]|uniref:FAD-binding domain-containing protein n=1 Tax=Parachaetomium inaequale TaxID=2588326 RepID=A0AAN6PDE0_9PEZI|nr:hypothetical protein C8A01DRAFT_17381 [Parachaetomium inaequale]